MRVLGFILAHCFVKNQVFTPLLVSNFLLPVAVNHARYFIEITWYLIWQLLLTSFL